MVTHGSQRVKELKIELLRTTSLSTFQGKNRLFEKYLDYYTTLKFFNSTYNFCFDGSVKRVSERSLHALGEEHLTGTILIVTRSLKTFS